MISIPYGSDQRYICSFSLFIASYSILRNSLPNAAVRFIVSGSGPQGLRGNIGVINVLYTVDTNCLFKELYHSNQ